MAIKRWSGNAPAVFDLWTISLSGTVINQTYTMTINSKTVTTIAGGADTVATIMALLVASWNASTIAEFSELTAAGLPTAGPFTSMTITGKVAGRPSTITVSTSGAAAFTIAHTTTATGPNDFSNAQNWSGGVAPANADTLVFDNGNVSCKYNLATALTGITVSVELGYAGAIGLPLINSESITTYQEYRTTNLTLAGGTAVISATAITRCNLAFGANLATVRVLNTGNRPDKFVPVVLLTGGNGASELDLSRGDVGIAFYQGDTANFPSIKQSYITNTNSDAQLYCGSGATLGTVLKIGGSLTINSAVTSLTQGPKGGSTTIAAGTVTTLDCQGGTAIYNSTGTLTTVNVSNDGLLDFDQDPRSVTVTNTIQVYGDKAIVRDNQKRVNSGVLTFQLNKTQVNNIQHGSGNLVVQT